MRPLDFETLARSDGAEIIASNGQFRAGRAQYVTEWHDTAQAAWCAYCFIAGLIDDEGFVVKISQQQL